ncbi:angiopoietin-related protein 7 [Drosophila busckii]|uniref:angiopoietin-related protein 7 n=1 Tax=Drosophila busckii TaxID=30019 RepID=UPI00083EEE7B|nr:angiopoietin-related protein 7 [Drosophila busckii]
MKLVQSFAFKLFVALILLCHLVCCEDISSDEEQTCGANTPIDKQCGGYTYKVMKPILVYLKQLQDTVNNNNIDTLSTDNKQLIEKVKGLEQQLTDLRASNEFQKQIIDQFTSSLALINQKTTNIEDLSKQILELHSAQQVQGKTEELETRLTKLEAKEEIAVLPTSCLPFGQTPGMHKIQVAGLKALEVLCENTIAGPGWTVIQQRINGKENFYRDWSTYRDGFGASNADFFLGLEHIHRLTNERPHELYIYMERFNGAVIHAHYDQFKISDEADGYRLLRLGKMKGNGKADWFRKHQNMQFATHDRDNAIKCAQLFDSAWWFDNKKCEAMDLNAFYYGAELNCSVHTMVDCMSLKTVKMMIRPKNSNVK